MGVLENRKFCHLLYRTIKWKDGYEWWTSVSLLNALLQHVHGAVLATVKKSRSGKPRFGPGIHTNRSKGATFFTANFRSYSCYFCFQTLHNDKRESYGPTNCTEYSSSWEDDSDLAVQEIPQFQGNMKIQFTPSQPFLLRFTLILASHLRLGLANGPFPQSFPTKIIMQFSSQACYMPSLCHPHHFDYPSNMWWRVKIMKLFIM
jgi:hypothetical protein